MERKRIFACLLATGCLLYAPASFAIVNNNQVDLLTSQNAPSAVEKRGSAPLNPKWSLPFQGQLVSQKVNTQTAVQTVTAKNDLTLFTPKKYQVLTLSPQETLKDTLVADASLPDASGTKQAGKLMSGGVSVWDGPFDGDRIVNHLLETHFENSPEGKKLDAQVKRHSGLGHRAVAATKDGLNEAFSYQGIDPSMRAGKLILDSSDMKIRNKAWADYVRQRYIDKIHAEVVTSLMQISEGIGNSENEHGKEAIASGKKELSALVGEEEAERAVKALTAWLNNTNVPYSTFAQAPQNTMEHTKALEEVLSAAVDKDPVIAEVTKRLKKFAYPSELNRRSSQIIQTALTGATIFGPGVFTSLGAGTAEVVYKLGTGGSEENKLERELLFDKRVQSRLKVLTQEASLALDNYRYALVTKNPPLLAFSQEVLENLTGAKNTSQLANAPDFDSTNKFVPEIKESGKSDESNTGSKVKFLVRNVRQMTICPGHTTQ